MSARPDEEGHRGGGRTRGGAALGWHEDSRTGDGAAAGWHEGGRTGDGAGADWHEDGATAARVLTDRVAAALVQHEPGWRLPRRSALARRYGVSQADMEAAIGELVDKQLLRRLPDGQVYRASPADYLIGLEGLRGLRACIDPMGVPIERATRHLSWRRVPEDIGEALGLSPGDPVCVVRYLWTTDGMPAACSATYLPERYAALAEDPPALMEVIRAPHGPGPPAGGQRREDGKSRPELSVAGLYVEFQPPAPSVARSLHLAAGHSAVAVIVRFDESSGSRAALAITVLRPDVFRVVIDAPGPRISASSAGRDVVWTRAAGGWEP